MIRGDDALRDIARELVQLVRKNTSIDWTLKEQARARLRTLVERPHGSLVVDKQTLTG